MEYLEFKIPQDWTKEDVDKAAALFTEDMWVSLWNNPATGHRLFRLPVGSIKALDTATLGDSPIQPMDDLRTARQINAEQAQKNSELMELGRLWKKFYGDTPLPMTAQASEKIKEWFAQQPPELKQQWGMNEVPCFDLDGKSLGLGEFFK